MGSVLCEDGDFKSIHRTDMIALQRFVGAKKSGISEVAYKDTQIKIGVG